MTGRDKYETFHGRAPRRIRSVNFRVPKTLVYIGEAVAVEYLCDKLNGGGDGKKAVYRHEFSSGAIVAMDEKAQGQLYILGNKIKVNDRGIIH